MRKHQSPRGLVLLVVLGMLSLFSLLAVTYVVFANAAKTSSQQMIRRDYRGTSPSSLLDMSIRQVIRGTSDSSSALWRQSILEDYYGSLEDPISTKARDKNFDVPGRVIQNYTPPTYPTTQGSIYGPQLYDGHFLKIPLDYSQGLPLHHHALVGRVLTFQDGPLANYSFTIIRYVGQLSDAEMLNPAPPLPPNNFDSIQFSVLIDLADAKEQLITFGTQTKYTSDWISGSTHGDQLLYSNYNGNLTQPYSLLINPGVQNAPGFGVYMDKTQSPPVVKADKTFNGFVSNINVPLTAPYDSVSDGILMNHQYTNLVTRKGATYTLNGDSDEDYDAADYNNAFLASRRGSASSSADVTPSFHRPAVINYLAALQSSKFDLANTQEGEFLSFLELVRRSTMRPLSYTITNTSVGTIKVNTHFTGGASFEANNGLRIPQLSLDWNNRGAQQADFDAWLRWLIAGSWDVDNDDDGIKDSVWIDLNFPLSTAPDGKLLKVLAAFYIEDLDSKLDINAGAASNQAVDNTFPVQMDKLKFAYLANSNNAQDWPQGSGVGAADLYLRHLFDNQNDHQAVMKLRYSSNNPNDQGKPGEDNKNDLLSKIIAHQSDDGTSISNRVMHPTLHDSTRLPGLPMSKHGRLGIALDLLGNPIIMQGNVQLKEEEDDPYESSILGGGYYDRHLSIGEWERLVRYRDPDRSALPENLEKAAGYSWRIQTSSNTLNNQFLSRIRSISPRNVATNFPRFNRTYNDDPTKPLQQRRVAAFVEFLEEYMQRRFARAFPALTNTQLAQLFPLEFGHNQPLNLNRPFGNGYDDNDNGSVDEPSELALGFPSTNENELYLGGSNTKGDYIGGATEFDPGFDPLSVTPTTIPVSDFSYYSGARSRQLFARHLYCLAQLVLPVNASGDNVYIFPNQPNKNTPVDNDTRARILAQWAVNVVDYRDADCAMTRFAYDPDPFRNGANYFPAWQPDNNHVVFGVENPELVITETIATHDIRAKIKRTPMGDQKLQMRLPEGSLFLEFFCPRSGTSNAAEDIIQATPPSLYTTRNNQAALNLGKVVVDNTDPMNPVRYPVWRVLFTEPQTGTTDAFTNIYDGDDIETTSANKGLGAFDYSYQLGNSSAGLRWKLDTPGPGGPKVDRVLWFANIQPDETTFHHANYNGNIALAPGEASTGFSSANVFYYQGGVNTPLCGQYFVVGPRPVTYFGSRTQQDADPREHQPNPHRIQIAHPIPNTNPLQYNFDWVQVWSQDNDAGLWITQRKPVGLPNNAVAAAFSPMVRDCVTMVAGADMRKLTWAPDTDIFQSFVGLNISEPVPGNNYYPKPDHFVNATATNADTITGAPAYKDMSKDGYLDMTSPSWTGSRQVFDTSAAPYFLKNHGWNETANSPEEKTQPHWSAAVLQRLADPDLAWHPVLNPYITVDWQSIDLTVFSGEDDMKTSPTFTFASREKAGKHIKLDNATRTLGAAGQTFFSYSSSFPPSSIPAPANPKYPVYFQNQLPLEFIVGNAATPRGPGTHLFTLGYLNSPFGLRNYTPGSQYYDADYLGAPSRVPDAPFHPNRDFINPLELTNVTLSSPGTFNQDFYFEPTTNTNLPRHTHTLDFDTLLGTNVPGTIAELLETVGVGSQWPDAWNVMDPSKVAPVNSNPPFTKLLSTYTAPFNFVPTFREPGRVNLNTATEPLVYRGLMGLAMGSSDRLTASTTPYEQDMRNSIFVSQPSSVLDGRGGSGNTNLNSTYPTDVLGVFRSVTSKDMFPLANLQRARTTDVTLLRRDSTNNRVLNPAGLKTTTTNSLLSETPMSGAYTAINNAYTYNYPMTRLSNLTTSRSNVFAIRVTLGFFEYDVNNGIGAEYGAEQGQSQRHRAFYVIDRSIPVGFEPGKDNNTSNIILSRRIVE